MIIPCEPVCSSYLKKYSLFLNLILVSWYEIHIIVTVLQILQGRSIVPHAPLTPRISCPSSLMAWGRAFKLPSFPALSGCRASSQPAKVHRALPRALERLWSGKCNMISVGDTACALPVFCVGVEDCCYTTKGIHHDRNVDQG